MIKKIISILSFVALFSTITLPSFAGYLNPEQIDAANNLADKKIINNHFWDPENYDLNDNVLRQEIAAIARWMYEIWEWKNILDLKKKRCDNIFADVSSIIPNSWACYSIEALIDNNIISSNLNFRPEDNITKAETIGMLIKSIWFEYEFDDTLSIWWQEQIVDFAVKKGIIEKFTDYNTNATRWWVFMIANITLKIDKEEKRIEDEQWIHTNEPM